MALRMELQEGELQQGGRCCFQQALCGSAPEAERRMQMRPQLALPLPVTPLLSFPLLAAALPPADPRLQWHCSARSGSGADWPAPAAAANWPSQLELLLLLLRRPLPSHQLPHLLRRPLILPSSPPPPRLTTSNWVTSAWPAPSRAPTRSTRTPARTCTRRLRCSQAGGGTGGRRTSGPWASC